MEQISFGDFSKIEIKVGEVCSASAIKGSDNLYKLEVDFGELETRTVISGIKKWYKVKDLKGKRFLFVTNLESKKIMGNLSQAMILAVTDAKSGKITLVKPVSKITPGSLLS